MFEAVKSPCLVPFNGDFKLSEASTLAETIVESLKSLDLQYPPVSKKQLDDIGNMRRLLEKPS